MTTVASHLFSKMGPCGWPPQITNDVVSVNNNGLLRLFCLLVGVNTCVVLASVVMLCVVNSVIIQYRKHLSWVALKTFLEKILFTVRSSCIFFTVIVCVFFTESH